MAYIIYHNNYKNKMISETCSLSFWLKYIETLDKKNKLDLVQLKYVAQKLDLLNIKSFIFTVGGTNGKGTTCKMLEKLLLNSGYRVGLYTSPHLVNYKERIRINGHFLDENEHVSSFQIIESERKDASLTYFDFITLSALMLFQQHELDIIILEVGLGGRLDSTNIIDSNLSIITNIGIDHTSILGQDRSSIAREKSGIFRKNKIAVIGEINIPKSINEVAQEKKTILKKVNLDWFWNQHGDYWNFIHTDFKLYNLPLPKIPLSSASTALAALHYAGFKINEKIIRKSLPYVKLPGRFQIISTNPYLILDVAHNPDAALYLSKRITSLKIEGKIYAIVGVLADKDIKGIISPLKNKIHYWYVATLKTSRTATIKQLKSNFPQSNTCILNSIDEAYKKAFIKSKKNDAILVFGSFLTVSEFIKIKSKK